MAAMPDRPNILLLMTDQQRWDALGCVGGWVNTPNLDRLASEGVRFDSCVTTAPICVPARLNFATGLYCHNTQVWHNAPHTMAIDTPTWMRDIRKLGYHSALFGKTHWHPHQGDLREREHLLHAYGFDVVNETTGPRASVRCGSHMTDAWAAQGVWKSHQQDYATRSGHDATVVRPSALPLEAYYDVYVGQQAKAYLDGYTHDQPWFCFVSFPGPHEPWDTPEPFASMHDPASMPAARPFPADTGDRPRGLLDRRYNAVPQHDAAQIAQMRADYAGNIALIDDQIGQLLVTLEQRGELDHTIIAFTSDHGELNGDAGLVYKANFLDGSVRVPMIVRTPQTAAGVTRGTVNEHPVEWSDLGPTLVELAGGRIEHPQFAKSLVPALNTVGIAVRDDAVSESGGELMLMTDEWKLALNREGQVYLLFDRRNDPLEQRNLIGEPGYRDTTDALRRRALERLLSSQTGVGLDFTSSPIRSQMPAGSLG